MRLSFSNLFKEFKSTSTWLQFPFVAGSGKENAGIIETKGRGTSSSTTSRPAPESTRWILLVLDLRAILSKYIHAKFAYLRNVKLCANLLVKNVFSSSYEYSPLYSTSEEQGYAQALPREMAFPLPKGKEFLELFDYIRFPVEMAAGGLRGVTSSLSRGKSLQGGRSDVVLVDGGVGVGGRGGEVVEGERGRGVTGERTRGRRTSQKSLGVSLVAYSRAFTMKQSSTFWSR